MPIFAISRNKWPLYFIFFNYYLQNLFKQSCEEEGIQLAALNAQVIAYRDKNEDYDWLEISETYSLPDQRSEYNDFVNGLRAKGGGDTPESGLEALQAAFGKTDWGIDDGYHRQVRMSPNVR